MEKNRAAAMIRHFLFDLDNTLYPLDQTELLHEVRKKMEDWICTHLHIPRQEARRLREFYRERYGSTLRGLCRHYGVDPEKFLREVHDTIDPRRFLQPNEALRNVLENLPAPASILSNAPASWVERVLKALGVRSFFEHIFDIAFADYRGKPDPEVYRACLAHLKLSPEQVVFLEDDPANAEAAAEVGLVTFWVGKGKPPKGVAGAVPSVLAMPERLTQVCEGSGVSSCR